MEGPWFYRLSKILGDFLDDAVSFQGPEDFLGFDAIGLRRAEGREVLTVFLIFDGLFQHLLEAVHHDRKGVFGGQFDILLGEFFFPFGVLDEVIDAMFQGLILAMLEDALGVEGEGTSRRELGIADDGHRATGEGLDAGNAPDLEIGGVDVEVGVIEDISKRLLALETDDRHVGQFHFLGQSQITVFLRALPAEDQLDLLVIGAFRDRADDKVLPLLPGEAAGHRDDVFPF